MLRCSTSTRSGVYMVPSDWLLGFVVLVKYITLSLYVCVLIDLIRDVRTDRGRLYKSSIYMDTNVGRRSDQSASPYTISIAHI